MSETTSRRSSSRSSTTPSTETDSTLGPDNPYIKALELGYYGEPPAKDAEPEDLTVAGVTKGA